MADELDRVYTMLERLEGKIDRMAERIGEVEILCRGCHVSDNVVSMQGEIAELKTKVETLTVLRDKAVGAAWISKLAWVGAGAIPGTIALIKIFAG